LYKLTVVNDSLPEGEPVILDGLGLFENKVPQVLDEITVKTHEINIGMSIVDIFKNNPMFVLETEEVSIENNSVIENQEISTAPNAEPLAVVDAEQGVPAFLVPDEPTPEEF